MSAFTASVVATQQLIAPEGAEPVDSTFLLLSDDNATIRVSIEDLSTLVDMLFDAGEPDVPDEQPAPSEHPRLVVRSSPVEM